MFSVGIAQLRDFFVCVRVDGIASAAQILWQGKG